MTDDAQAILRKVIEKYVNNVRFCFICNYLKKINPAIQSRCIMFRFKPIPNDYMLKFVNNILKTENLNLNNNVKKIIINKSNGDMRKLLNILQSIYMYSNNLNNNIDEYTVSKILSCPTDKYINNILIFVQKNNLEKSIDYIVNIINEFGLSLNELLFCVYEKLCHHIINNNKIITYDNNKCCEIIKNISIINENLTSCNSDNIQIIAFISLFYL